MMNSSSAGRASYPRAEHPRDAEHVSIYYDRAEFAAWPFSHGFWAFPGGGLLISFSRGPCRYEQRHDVTHEVVDTLSGEYVTLRSVDGGRTWPLDTLQVLGTHQGLERELLGGAAKLAPDEPPDWASPDFCLTTGFAQPPQRARHVGYLQYSRDRGLTWDGPYPVPSFGFSWVQVKPDYVVRPDGVVLLFVTVARGASDGRAGSRFVAVYGTQDRGLTWNYLAPIMPISPDSPFVNRYYAAPVLLPNGRILAALRCQIDARNAWPEIFASEDGGRTWRFVSRPSDWGGPTHLIRLDDGRLLIAYGYRTAPYGIRARVTEDEGLSWGPELVLRDDAGSWDLGYPRIVKLPGGRVMVAYYFNSADDPIQCGGGVRHIAATIFTP